MLNPFQLTALMTDKTYYVYILSNKPHGTLYTGVTGNLMQRVFTHKYRCNSGFVKKYNVTKLVWFAETNNVAEALELEKRLKKWRRKWKIELIEKQNPEWQDLYENWSA